MEWSELGTVQALVDQYDESNYYQWLNEFPNQVEEAVQKGRELSLEQFPCSNVLVCGMGGSGITGDLLKQFNFYGASVPIQTNRFYKIPSWVDEQTFVIGVSYSGNTEETVGAFKQASRNDANLLAITSDGDLRKFAGENDIPTVDLPPSMPPRASAGFLFIPTLFALSEIDVASEPEKKACKQTVRHLKDMVEEFKPGNENNRCFQIARNLQGKIPLVYGSQEVTNVLSTRFKNQLNENAKVFACSGEFPEMNHNEIMALDFLKKDPERYHVIFLRDRGEHERIQQRFSILREMFEGRVSAVDTIETRGRALLTRYFSMMLETDFVSYYLALVNETDPTSVHYIEQLKEQL